MVAPNPARLLRRLGVLEDLATRAIQLDVGWEFRRWEDGRVLSAEDLPADTVHLGQSCVEVDVAPHCRGGVAALQRYETLPRPRTSKIQELSHGRSLINHLPDGPEQQQRDLMFASADPLLANGWIYGYDPEAELARAP